MQIVYYRTSIILLRIIRNLTCRASAFFLSKPWPFWAPARRSFINIWALKTEEHHHKSLDVLYTHHTFFYYYKTGELTPEKGKLVICPSETFWFRSYLRISLKYPFPEGTFTPNHLMTADKWMLKKIVYGWSCDLADVGRWKSWNGMHDFEKYGIWTIYVSLCAA